MDIEIVQEPSQRIAFVRGSLAAPGEAWHGLMAVLGVSDLFGQPSVSTLAVFSSGIVSGAMAPGEAIYDAALVLPEGVHAPSGITEGSIPAGRYARATHMGPYEGLQAAWRELAGAVAARSLQVAADGVCLEAYRNAPGSVPDAELRTDLYVPLA